jgi:Tfp pilus assembly protein PilF
MDLSPELLSERAIGHMLRREYAPAAILLQEALTKNPKYSDAWSNRGLCLLQLGHPFDAILHFEKAISLEPTKNPEFYNNMGASYFNLGQPEKSIECYFKTLELNKDSSEALLNLGNAFKFKRDLKKAIEYYRQCIQLKPEMADCHLHLSFALLEDGQYAEGWKEFEWRWKTDQLPARGLKIPQWEGQSLEGKKLLLYAEQGFGDWLQFCRYAPVIKQLFGGKIAVEVRNQVARLSKTVPGVDEVFVFGDKLPSDIDYVLPIMSAPLICGTTIDSIPWYGPYFEPDKSRVEMWRQKLEVLPPGLRVGICWAGQSRPGRPEADAVDQRRSTELKMFAPLALVPGVSWVSLQKGPPMEQVANPPPGMTIGHWMEEADDFYDTAALIECLDLVISVDTAVVHVAGALNKPTWVLSRYDNCWRWLGHREDCPWYPSMRQFVQPQPGAWEAVMETAAVALRKFVREKSKKAA